MRWLALLLFLSGCAIAVGTGGTKAVVNMEADVTRTVDKGTPLPGQLILDAVEPDLPASAPLLKKAPQ